MDGTSVFNQKKEGDILIWAGEGQERRGKGERGDVLIQEVSWEGYLKQEESCLWKTIRFWKKQCDFGNRHQIWQFAARIFLLVSSRVQWQYWQGSWSKTVVRGEPERWGALTESTCVHGTQKLSSKNRLLMEYVKERLGRLFPENVSRNKRKQKNKNKNKGYVMGNWWWCWGLVRNCHICPLMDLRPRMYSQDAGPDILGYTYSSCGAGLPWMLGWMFCLRYTLMY